MGQASASSGLGLKLTSHLARSNRPLRRNSTNLNPMTNNNNKSSNQHQRRVNAQCKERLASQINKCSNKCNRNNINSHNSKLSQLKIAKPAAWVAGRVLFGSPESKTARNRHRSETAV